MFDKYEYKYDSLEDPYVYPGTRILRNKFGIKHQDLLSELESQITNSKFVKSKQGDDDIPTGNFDLKHLQAVHQYLFGELYDWAGEIHKQGFIIDVLSAVNDGDSLLSQQLALPISSVDSCC